MSDERKIEVLGAQISNLSPMITSLEKTLLVTNKEIENLYKTVDLATEERKTIRISLYGNGDHEGGMAGRIHKMEMWIENQVWFQRLLIALIAGEAVGIIYIVVNHALGS